MIFCEAWRNDHPTCGKEIFLEKCNVPPSALDGIYCVPDGGGLRTLCGKHVYRVLPYVQQLGMDAEMCPECDAAMRSQLVISKRRRLS